MDDSEARSRSRTPRDRTGLWGLLVLLVCLAGLLALWRWWGVGSRWLEPDGGGPAPTQPAELDDVPSLPASAPAASRPPATTRPTTATTPVTAAWRPPRFAAREIERRKMVRTLREGYGLIDADILAAMTSVPRHEFVPDDYDHAAYADGPLPIGYGQTISQPYIVAEMTRQLQLTGASRVLEIGTGSGYQAAVLNALTPHVYSIEIVKPLASAARKRLKRLGYRVAVGHADGYYGWKRHAPFDAIIVTCAAGQIPPPLLRQLAPGGRMMIPVGAPMATQSLILITKDQDGTVRSRSLMAVRFVPLRRKDVSAK